CRIGGSHPTRSTGTAHATEPVGEASAMPREAPKGTAPKGGTERFSALVSVAAGSRSVIESTSLVSPPPWRRCWSRDGSASIVVTDRDDRCRQGPQHEVAAGGGGQGQVECLPRLAGAVVEDGDRHRLVGLPVGERQHLAQRLVVAASQG